jgi:hypothetical protein
LRVVNTRPSIAGIAKAGSVPPTVITIRTAPSTRFATSSGKRVTAVFPPPDGEASGQDAERLARAPDAAEFPSVLLRPAADAVSKKPGDLTKLPYRVFAAID